MTVTTSVLIMAIGAAVVLLGAVALVRRLAPRVTMGLTVISLLAGFATIWLVDVNVPLAASHWRPDGGPVPFWVALGAWLSRVLPIAIIAAGARQRVTAKLAG